MKGINKKIKIKNKKNKIKKIKNKTGINK